MCGGLAVISDVPKTMVYSLSRIANRRLANVPGERLHQAAFSELKPVEDADSLPEYEILDRILEACGSARLARSRIRKGSRSLWFRTSLIRWTAMIQTPA